MLSVSPSPRGLRPAGAGLDDPTAVAIPVSDMTAAGSQNDDCPGQRPIGARPTPRERVRSTGSAVAAARGDLRPAGAQSMIARMAAPAARLRAVPGLTEANRRWWTLVGTCMGLFVLMLDSTVIYVALPDIARDLDRQRTACSGW